MSRRQPVAVPPPEHFSHGAALSYKMVAPMRGRTPVPPKPAETQPKRNLWAALFPCDFWQTPEVWSAYCRNWHGCLQSLNPTKQGCDLNENTESAHCEFAKSRLRVGYNCCVPTRSSSAMLLGNAAIRISNRNVISSGKSYNERSRSQTPPDWMFKPCL